VKDFESKGVTLVKDLDELTHLPKGRIIVRSHGISRAEYEEMEGYGFEVVDATCPFVRKIHRLVDEHSAAGEYVVIIGNPKHPEVCGIRGWVNGEDVSIIESVEEAEAFILPRDKKTCIVSQTTFNYNKFQDLVEIIREKGYDVESINTICNATEERQTEAKLIAGTVDGMIVIGGSHSSNTQKLFEICKKECENTHYIQTLEDLSLDSLKNCECIGITAGASTPNNIIEEVQKHVRIKF
jgi:4-hydroxy-3-methylbut-2-enyl diphosphate reductase